MTTWLNHLKHVVYIHRDAAGEALYVGVTTDLKHRMRSHRYSASWFDQIDDVEIAAEGLDRPSAFAREAELIETLRPPHNVQPGWRRTARGTPPKVAVTTPDPVERPFITARQVAPMFNVSPATVGRWARTGRLPSITLPSGHFRFRPEAIERVITDAYRRQAERAHP